LLADWLAALEWTQRGEKKEKMDTIDWRKSNQIKSNQYQNELLFLLFFKGLVWGQSRTREDKWSMTRQSNAV